MQLLFRVDSSVGIGTGHVMRCLCLARALRDSGATPEFICAPLEGHVGGLIENEGFRVHWLSAQLGAFRQSVDASACREILASAQPDWLVIDHYGLDAEWEQQLEPVCKRMLVIDDLPGRQHDCALYLNPGFVDDSTPGPGVRARKYLLGPQYALLREEFARVAEAQPAAPAPLRLLLSLGGSDPDNVTRRLLEWLRDRPELEGLVIAGAANPELDSLMAACEELPGLDCIPATGDIAQCMLEAAVGIGAGGHTAWERCCVGLPSLIITTADNQRNIAKGLHAAGAAIDLGPAAALERTRFLNALDTLCGDAGRREKMRLAGRALVDGLGVARVIEQMQLEPGRA